jgi:zinc protease
MIVGVSGDFDPVAMEQKLRAALSDLPPKRVYTPDRMLAPRPRPGVYTVDKADVNQSNIWIVGLGTERRNPDYYALAVMNEIFSGGFGSRLFQQIRTRLGLAYAAYGSYGAGWDHPGMFRVVASTRNENTVKTARAMLEEIARLKTQPFTEEELKSAKDQILNSFIFEYDSRDKILAAQASFEFYGYPETYLEHYRDQIERVTTADLERVAKTYIDPARLAILVVGNQAEIRPPVSTLGPAKPIDITIPAPAGMKPDPAAGDQP